MERVIVNEGTKTPLYQLFEDLQNYTNINDLRIMRQLIERFGVNCGTTAPYTADLNDPAMLVTIISGTSDINVHAGEGLTPSFQYIGVPSTNLSVASLNNGGHVLYVKAVTTYSNPVNVMSGFAYNVSGIAQRNSRSHDSYGFQWDLSPGNSGLMLATVTISNGTALSVADMRGQNVLKLNRDVLPDAVLRTDNFLPQTLAGPLTVRNYLELSDGSGLNYPKINVEQLKIVEARISGIDTLRSTGTALTDFRVGVGTMNAGAGWPVKIDASFNMVSPTKFKIVDIQPANPTSKEPKAAVYFSWNCNNVGFIGTTGGMGTITNPSDYGGFVNDELIGMWLYIFHNNTATNYLIVDNTTTTVSVNTLDGEVPNLTGVNTANGDKVKIHCGATSYTIECNGESTSVYGQDKVAVADHNEGQTFTDNYQSPWRFGGVMSLPIGDTYTIYIYATRSHENISSILAPKYLSAGTFYKNPSLYGAASFTYSSPTLIQLPTVLDPGDQGGTNDISIIPLNFGYRVYVTERWKAANYIQVASAPGDNAATWNAGAGTTIYESEPKVHNQGTEMISPFQVDVSVPTQTLYNIKIRPMQAGQPVTPGSGDYPWPNLNKTVGGLIVSSQDQTLFTGNIELMTFHGNISESSASYITISTTTTPWTAGGTGAPAVLTAANQGDIITDSQNKLFILKQFIDSDHYTSYFTWAPADVALFGSGPPATGFCKINVAEDQDETRTIARKVISQGGFASNMQLSRVYIDVWSITGTSAHMRVFQDTTIGRQYYDTSPIIQSAGPTILETDVQLLSSRGNLVLGIDFYDDADVQACNWSSISGTVYVYGRPLTIKDKIIVESAI